MPDDLTPAATPSPESEVLNPASLAALHALDASGGNAFARRVLSTYLQSLERHVHMVRQVSVPGGEETWRAVTHTLKSSSESIGALEFARHCGALESRLRAQLEKAGCAHAENVEAVSQTDLDRFFDIARRVDAAVRVELARGGRE